LFLPAPAGPIYRSLQVRPHLCGSLVHLITDQNPGRSPDCRPDDGAKGSVSRRISDNTANNSSGACADRSALGFVTPGAPHTHGEEQSPNQQQNDCFFHGEYPFENAFLSSLRLSST
jgi:hypothetical protein